MTNLDEVDDRTARAIAAHGAMAPHPTPAFDSTITPRGLTIADVQQAIAAAGGDAQAGWDRVLAAYLDADISLGRAAELLGLSRLELAYRFQRLGVPLPGVALSVGEILTDLSALGDQGN